MTRLAEGAIPSAVISVGRWNWTLSAMLSRSGSMDGRSRVGTSFKVGLKPNSTDWTDASLLAFESMV